MPTFPAVSTIAQTIQLSLSPIFMLAGIGALLNVLTGRLARVVDRGREVERLRHEAGVRERERFVWELRLVNRRIGLINTGLSLAVASAVVTCLVVVLLFVAELFRFHIGRAVSVSFILAMVLLIAALGAFMLEVRVATRALRIRPELIEHVG